MDWGFTQRVLTLLARSGADITLTKRVRASIAEVNAGIVLVPTVDGQTLKLVDAKIISVGGAAAGATTVDILATLAGVSRKLVAGAVANLTQSAILRPGATGGTVLADGASFTANDVGTPITAAKTGGALTGSVHIDFEVQYILG